MTYKGLWKIFLALGVSITLAACDTSGQGVPVIQFELAGGSNSIVTPDSSMSLAGTALSQHPIVSVTWANDRGGEGIAQGLDDWQIPNIALQLGDNTVTVTAADDAGNENSQSVIITRDSSSPAITGNDGSTGSSADTGVSTPVLMYSYSSNLKNPAPASGAKLDRGTVYFYVVPSDNWRKSGIDHMAYYCCDKPGANASAASKLAVSREPWSMAIDLSSYAAGEKRSINIEANLASGVVLKAPEYDFTLSGSSSASNRTPSISGTPATKAVIGSNYDFRPKASDADSDTLSFSVAGQPSWAKFDQLSGRLWGVPGNGDAGIYSNIVISVSDGKSSRSLSAFTISVAAATTTTPPPAPPPSTTPPPTTTTPPPASTTSAPDIVSFTTSSGAITQGSSVTLRWTVNGATSLSVSPQPGKVSGSSVSVSPSSTTTYRLTATNASGSSTASVTVSVLSGSSDWNVSERPPALSSPRVVDLSTLGTVNINVSSLNCGGKIYRVSLGNDQDAIVKMSGSQPLKYPLHVTGGRNVRLVGLHFSLATQPGCGVGQLPNNPVADHPNANIHPRIPGAIAVRLQQSGVSFLEGLHIDVKGHEADCIVGRNPDSMSDAVAQSQRDIIVQNTSCAGVEGLGASPIGDGVHGDLFQNQGRDIMRRLIFENVSMRTSQEGIVLHGNGGSLPGAKTLVLRRYDYTWDPRYVGDDNYEHFGLAFAGRPASNGWTLEDVRIDDYRDGLDYMNIDGQRYGNSPSSNVLPHPQIRSGRPAQGAFALPGRTGVNYVSPHGGVP